MISVSGKIGSGKSICSKYIADKIGCKLLKTSKFLEHILQANELEVNRESLQKLGEGLIRVASGRGFMSMLLENLQNSKVVVDSIRYPDAVSYLKSNYGKRYIHIHIVSKDEVRFARLQDRDKCLEISILKKWEESDTEKHNEKLNAVADFTVENDGDFETTKRKLDEIIYMIETRG